MRVELKGVNKVTKRLADGSRITYFYAWKGGPRLTGEPGTVEFHASYTAAIEAERRAPGADLRSLIDQYLQSSAFLDLADRTKVGYKYYIKRIETDFSDLPLSALTDRRTRGLFLAWRDEMGLSSKRSADYSIKVLARIISWGVDRGLAPANPCEKPGLLYKGSRSEAVWTAEQERAFYESAPEHLHLALMLGLWTGQRQRDLLTLKWSQYDGDQLRFKQHKTGAYVPIPVGGPLRQAIETAKAKLVKLGVNDAIFPTLTILATSRGARWTTMGFSASWRKACAKAGVVGVTYHDLRGTAVTRLAVAGCTVPEIASITGHSLRDVDSMLDKHYLKRDQGLAISAIRKLEKGQQFQLPAQPATNVVFPQEKSS